MSEQQDQGPVKHVTEQLWEPEVREDGVYLVGADDRSTVLKMCRPDHGSDLFIAGLQLRKLPEEKP